MDCDSEALLGQPASRQDIQQACSRMNQSMLLTRAECGGRQHLGTDNKKSELQRFFA